MQYCVVNKFDDLVLYNDNLVGKFENEVNKKIKMGWKPIGGISVLVFDGSYMFSQAMIKEENEDSKN